MSSYLDSFSNGCRNCIQCGDKFAANLAYGFGVASRSIAFERTGTGDMGYTLDMTYSDDITLFSQSKACNPVTGACADAGTTVVFGFSIHYFVTTVKVTPSGGSPTTLPVKFGLIGRSSSNVVRLGEFASSSFTPSGSSIGPVSGSASISIPISVSGSAFTLEDNTTTDSFRFDCDINRDGVVNYADCTALINMIGANIGSTSYNPRGDFNLSGSITTADGPLMRTLLNSGFGAGITYGDLDADNDVDCADAIAAASAWGHSYPDTEYRVELDYNLDGVLDASDKVHFDAVCTCATSAATCGPGWVGGANPPSASTVVRAVTSWDADNTPTITGPLPADLVAAYSNSGTSAISTWNGAAWTTLASGVSGTVDALTVDSDGYLIAAGSFSSIGGVSASNIARWNGSAWVALGAGTNGRVRAMIIDPTGALAIGGDFTTAGGSTVNHLAAWSGSAWSSIGGGTNGSVLALGYDPNGNLAVGGSFTSAGGSSIGRGIAAWDGSSWSAFGSGIGNNSVTCLASLSTGDLVAGGSFTSANGVSSTGYIARWDGTAWHALGSGMDGPVNALYSLASGKFIAGGSFAASGTKPLRACVRSRFIPVRGGGA